MFLRAVLGEARLALTIMIELGRSGGHAMPLRADHLMGHKGQPYDCIYLPAIIVPLQLHRVRVCTVRL